MHSLNFPANPIATGFPKSDSYPWLKPLGEDRAPHSTSPQPPAGSQWNSAPETALGFPERGHHPSPTREGAGFLIPPRTDPAHGAKAELSPSLPRHPQGCARGKSRMICSPEFLPVLCISTCCHSTNHSGEVLQGPPGTRSLSYKGSDSNSGRIQVGRQCGIFCLLDFAKGAAGGREAVPRKQRQPRPPHPVGSFIPFPMGQLPWPEQPQPLS